MKIHQLLQLKSIVMQLQHHPSHHLLVKAPLCTTLKATGLLSICVMKIVSSEMNEN